MMLRLKQNLLILFLLVSACDQAQHSRSENSAIGDAHSLAFVISGVSSKGPIQGATINIFAMDANGNRTGTSLATTTTDNNGFWQVSITPAPTSSLLVESSGGSYVDEADPSPTNKRTINLNATEIIEGVLFPGQTTASITLLTDALLEKSRLESTSTDIQTVLFNNRNNAISGVGFDPFSIAATDPVAPSSAASDDSVEYAMYLGGIATALNSAAILLGEPVPDYAIMMGMVQDLSDGRLDGQDLNGVVSVNVNGTQQSFPNTLDLNQAILRFRNNNFHAYATTNVQAPITVDENALAQTGTNTFPVAQDDATTTSQGGAVTINVLNNDSDADGDALTASVQQSAANGSVTSPSNGEFVYTPNATFSGADFFDYSVSDGKGGSDTARVNINVIAQTVQNQQPFVFAGIDITNAQELTTISLNGGAQDPDGAIASVNWAQTSGAVSVAINDPSNLVSSVNLPAVATPTVIELTLTVIDDQNASASASINITINPVAAPPPPSNTPPNAVASVTPGTFVNEQSLVTLSGAASSDADGSISSYSWSQINGTSVAPFDQAAVSPQVTMPGVFVTQELLTFELTVTDDLGATDTASVAIVVNPVSSPPTANPVIVSTPVVAPNQFNEQTLVSVDGSGSADDGSITSFTWTQQSPTTPGLQGTFNPASGNGASVSFTSPDIANDTTFTLRLTVTDNEGDTDFQDIVVVVLSDNIGPTVVDDSATTPEDISITINNLLANDLDPNGNNTPFSIATITQPGNGSVVVEANNTDVTYTPNLNFNGIDTFTYTSTDSLGANSVNTATVSITVSGTNDDPVAVADTDSTVQGIPVTISNLTVNDTDPENDTLSITGVTQPGNGVSVNNGDGTVTYTPNLSFNGADSFTYSIVDGNGGSAIGTVNVTVIADSDGDGLIDSDEINVHSTLPNNADSDGDGFSDSHEILVGTNPNLNTQFPPNPLASSVISTSNSNNVISVDTTWSLANAPYFVLNDVSVQSGATLTIEPGVVVKLANNVDILVNAGGVLDAQGNAPVPQHVIFTSDHDDSINGDTNNDGGATTAAGGDWNGIDYNLNSSGIVRFTTVKNAANCISINNSSPVIDNVNVGDCSSFGINVSTTSGTRNANLSSIDIIDFNANGQSTGSHGIQVISSNAAIAVLNLSDINITEAGNSTSEHGLAILANGGDINGSVNNITATNPFGDGINIQNSFSGDVNLALLNLTVNGAGANSLDVRDTFATSGVLNTTFDGSNSFTNNATASTAVYFENNDPDFFATGSLSVDTAGFGMQLNNSAGSFRNITLNNTAIAGVRLQNASAPVVFSNIVLTNADTPYELVGQNLTPTIITGYDFSDPSVSKSYIRVLGTFPADMTLTPDPLNTGGAGPASVWRVPGDVTIPAGVTFTIADGAIVKFDLSRIVFVNGNLVVGDGDGLGANVILTSTRDESVGADADPTDATAPAAGNWNYFQLNNGSSVNIDNAIIRYMNRGIFQSFTNVTGFSISNSEFREFNTYGLDLTTTGNITYTLDNVTVANLNPSTNNSDGIRIANSGTRTITLDFDSVTVDTVGNDANNDRGIELFLDSNSLLTGRLDNITVSNTFGTGIILQNTTSGLVDPVFSGLNITNPGSTRYGLQLIGNSDGFTRPTVDNSCLPPTCPTPPTNFIGDASPGSGGVYGLLVQGVDGTYNNITISNTTSSALFMSGVNNPLAWDDATIVLNSSPSPWTIRTTFPASVGVLGTADLGFTAGTGLQQNYMQVNSALVDTILVADPLNTGSSGGPASVWRVDSDITIPAGVTLTINDGAIVKFDLNRIIFVNGNLVVGDGVVGGAQAILTSTRDETVGADADLTDSTLPAAGNWNYLQLNNGGSVNIDNAIIRYMNRGIFQSFTSIASFTLSNTDFGEFSTYGLDLTTTGNVTYTLNGVTVANQSPSTNNSDGIRIANSGTRTITLDFDNVTIDTVGNDVTNDRGLEIFLDSNSLLTGRLDNLTVNNTFGTAVLLQNTTAGLVNPVFSGLNITNPGSSRYGLQLIGNSDGFTQPTVDNSCLPPTCPTPPTNFIGNPSVADSGGVYGMLVQGVNGVYSNITISNTVSTTPINNPKPSALFISGVTNPSVWDDASIVLNNSASPWTIRTSFPASIGVLGTADLGYTAGTGLIQNYVQMNSTVSDMTLIPDPLNTVGAGPSSVWRVDTDVTIPSGVTLTINDGAIVKFDLSRIMNVNGNLVVGDGVAGGAQAILTSIRDESVGADADPANAAAPAAGNWNYIQINNGGSINIDNAIVRYMSRGIYQPSTAISSFLVTNTEIREFSSYGMDLSTAGNTTYTLNTVTVANQNPSTNNSDGIRIANSGTRTITLDFDNVTIDTVGNDAINDRGLELFVNSNSLLTGRLDNLTVSNTFGSGIILQNDSAGLVNPIFSGLNIFDVGNHGMQLIGLGAGNTTPTIDGSSGLNTIGSGLTAGSGGNLGLTFQGVDGNYSDITINSTSLSALYFSNNTNPTFGLNITLDNSPAPYSLVGIALPAGVSYTSGANLVEDYIRIFGDILTDLTLNPEPLGAGSYWRVPGNFRIPAATTLTLVAGTILKFDSGFQFDVQNGGTLNVNGTSGNHVVMTSTTDNDIGNGNSALLIDWEGLNFNAGSGGTINFLDIWYARDGIDLVNVTSNPVFNDLTVNYCQDGLRINSSTGMTLTFNNLSLNENSSNHLVLEGNGSLSTTFTEDVPGGLSIIDIPGNGADATHGIFISNTDTTNIVSGFTITGNFNPIRLASNGANIVENNIIRSGRSDGINHSSNGNPIVRNNVIVNNNGAGIFVSGNGNIISNLIRQNSRGAGGGLFISNSNVTVENNLIVENRSTSNTSNSGGSGIYINGNSSPTIINNTIANNTSADATNFEGAGMNVEASAGVTTLRDNILYGNTDVSNGANDLYDDVGRISIASNNLIGSLLASPGTNLYSADATDLVGVDPLHVQGWYLSSTPSQAANSPAIDSGSANASTILPVALNTRTTRTDGGLDGTGADLATVNLGYHYVGANIVADATNTSVVSSPPSPAIFVSGSPVIMTITPRDGSLPTPNIIGAGLLVEAEFGLNPGNPSTGTSTATGVSSTGSNPTLTTVRDLGDGSYEVTLNTTSGSTGSDTINFSVNGVNMNTTISVTWTL